VSTPDSPRPEGTPGPGAPDGAGPPDPDAIKAQIDATRAQLGRTVDELSHRLDVPARTKESVYRARDTAVETYRESPPTVLGAALALAVMTVGLVVWRRKRSSTRRNPMSTSRRRP